MATASSNAPSTTSIYAPGGSISKNSNAIWVVAIIAAVFVIWIFAHRRK